MEISIKGAKSQEQFFVIMPIREFRRTQRLLQAQKLQYLRFFDLRSNTLSSLVFIHSPAVQSDGKRISINHGNLKFLFIHFVASYQRRGLI